MKVVALAGGVGGAKLAHGFSKILPTDQFAVIVNTGDDFCHFGLAISPDLDTVCYTLSEKANPSTGWGRADETLNVFSALQELGGPDWFLLGDKDLALHLERTRLIKEGFSLTEITAKISRALDVRHAVLPMTDGTFRTMVNTVEYGEIPFQEYFVKYEFQPKTIGFRFAGLTEAKPSLEVSARLNDADLVVICPSNPFVSINPIISLGSIKEILKRKFVIGVSPIIGGKAVKGPLGLMFRNLNLPVDWKSVVRMYEDFLTAFVIDSVETIEDPHGWGSSIIIERDNILLPDIQTRVDLAKKLIRIYEKHK